MKCFSAAVKRFSNALKSRFTILCKGNSLADDFAALLEKYTVRDNTFYNNLDAIFSIFLRIMD